MKKLVPALFIASMLGGCIISPPPSSRSGSDPADPTAREGALPRLKPNLIASTRIFLDPSAGEDAQKMDHSKMQGMDHSKMPGMQSAEGADQTKSKSMENMPGMDHSKMPGMSGKKDDTMPGMKHDTPPPKDDAGKPAGADSTEEEMKKTADEMKKTSEEMKAKSDALQKSGGKKSGAMDGMAMPMPGAAGAPRNPATKEEKQNTGGPSGEQLQSAHPTSYTCRMHPSVNSAKPGKCPICGMTLVGKETLQKQKVTEKP